MQGLWMTALDSPRNSFAHGQFETDLRALYTNLLEQYGRIADVVCCSALREPSWSVMQRKWAPLAAAQAEADAPFGICSESRYGDESAAPATLNHKYQAVTWCGRVFRDSIGDPTISQD
jgi:hypothetical protein